MPILWLVLIVLALGAVGYILGRQRAMASAGGDARHLHSLPSYYGSNVAIKAVVPALVLMVIFMNGHGAPDVHWALYVMTLIAFVIGAHLVLAIGGADMPVVISLLNSYSGMAAFAGRSIRGWRQFRASGIGVLFREHTDSRF